MSPCNRSVSNWSADSLTYLTVLSKSKLLVRGPLEERTTVKDEERRSKWEREVRRVLKSYNIATLVSRRQAKRVDR